MKRLSIVCILFFLFACTYAQAPDAWVVLLKDKDTVAYSPDRPLEFLSPRAVEKRQRFHIPVTEADLPICRAYADSLSRLHPACKVLAKSKWFNYAVLGTRDSNVLNDSLRERIRAISWVKDVYALHQLPDSVYAAWFAEASQGGISSESSSLPETHVYDQTIPVEYWGASALQISCLNGLFLHRMQYTGKDMLVTVIDGGFYGVDSSERYASMKASGRLKGYMAFDDDTTAFYAVTQDHGQNVLSIMGVNEPYTFVGSAPDAEYVLLRSETSRYEDRLEEYYFTAAAEYADSIGSDVVNASLGYTVFDKEAQRHTWYDLDGKHSVASIAAERLTHKGCIVNVAAGNEGAKTWIFFGIPSDAPSALCIAAMDTDSAVASFSSRGNEYWMKPDIISIGKGTAYCNSRGKVSHGNGTSYASPMNAGLTACLWQAFPGKTAIEVMQAIRQSAHLYNRKWSAQMGYGIPDYEKAYHLLKGDVGVSETRRTHFRCYPNPVSEQLNVELSEGEAAGAELYLYDETGRLLGRQVFAGTSVSVNLAAYPQGNYFLLVRTPEGEEVLSVVK